jgi:hypothetical protein
MSDASETLERPGTYEPALALRCPFPGCNGALRLWDRGAPDTLYEFSECHICQSRIAISRAERREAFRKAVRLHLL